MKDQWYGDKRDLVKWGVLLQLAGTYGAQRIIQVAYYRPNNNWGLLNIDGKEHPLPIEVIKHFRDVRNASKLSVRPRIDVIDTPFENRSQYTQEIISVIAECGGDRCIVFLDPDTGLEPRGRAGYQHVLESELCVIWEGMRPGDVLVFYQHQTNKSRKEWIKPKRRQFENALGLQKGKAKLARGKTIARDVVFFFCQKAA